MLVKCITQKTHSARLHSQSKSEGLKALGMYIYKIIFTCRDFDVEMLSRSKNGFQRALGWVLQEKTTQIRIGII